MRITMNIVTALVGILTVLSAYAGTIDPRSLPDAAILNMLMPALAPLLLIVLVLDLLWWRRAAIAAAVCLLIALPSILDTYPLNISNNADKIDRSDSLQWSLLTYNSINLADLTGKYPGGINPTLSYILKTDADVVCLQEQEYMSAHAPFHISQAQIDSIAERYPYIILSCRSQCLLSKFPVQPINAGIPRGSAADGIIAAYILNIRGRRVALFNVHLHSFELTADDRELYGDMTRLKGGDSTISRMRSDVLPKIKAAAMARADEAGALQRLIRKYGGNDVVVCGDFNDVPGCFTLRRLADEGMHEVYPETGLGYMRTYNRNRFFFRIDHVLYRGNLKPLDMQRGDLMCSDHFPLLTTFTFTTDAK